MNVNSLYNKGDFLPSALDNVNPKVGKLFYSGTVPKGPCVTVIGSRRPTVYGRQMVVNIVEPLARAGVCIVSGLAIGIDGLAHKAAIEAGGKTLAILPSSIDRIYPSRHQGLARNIVENGGGLLTEYKSRHRPRKEDFIARNRILAAWSDITVVIEAQIKSGTSHTVNFALDLGKEVAAVPGPANSLLSKGPNNHIKNGAHLIESGEDVLEILGIEQKNASSLLLTQPEKQILHILQREPMTLFSLNKLVAFPEPKLSQHLLALELKGLIARSEDGVYASRL